MDHPLDNLIGFHVLGFTPSGNTSVLGTIGEVANAGAFIEAGPSRHFCDWSSVWFLDDSTFFVGAQVIQLSYPYPRGEVTFIDRGGDWLNIKLLSFANRDGSPIYHHGSKAGWSRVMSTPTLLVTYLEDLRAGGPSAPVRTRFEIMEDL